LTVNVGQAASCPITPGLADDIGNPPPDADKGSLGVRIYDGEGGVSVDCSVKATGNGSYSISASVSSTNPRVAMSLQSATVGANGSGTALIGLSTIALGVNVTSPPETPCTLTVVQLGDELRVKPGAIWTRWSCPRLASVPSPICMGSGEILLENCSK
jgi:hypothetical protein